MSPLDTMRSIFEQALRLGDFALAESAHKEVSRLEHKAMSEETSSEMDAGVESLYTGLDPMQIEYAKLVNQQVDSTNLMLNKSWIGAASGSITAGSTLGNIVKWNTVAKPMAIFKEPTQADKDTDKRRHLKLFVHFAKQFAERYPAWTVVPDPQDPLHSVHLVKKDIGAVIHNLYPSNEMAVYGGPASWTDPRKELGQALPIVKVNTQEFWGWCLGMDDVPEWMIQ